ncbi:MAG: ATP-binding protein [Candidatus Woesearchaeota archaeon]
MGFSVKVDKNKCIGCQTCTQVCPQGVFVMKDGKSEPVNEKNCVGCRACEGSCPTDAITVTEKKIK